MNIKKTYLFFLAAAMLIVSASCNKTKTYADYLKDESRAINRFISKNNITVLEEFPENGVFTANQFFRDPASGVYYNIISYGDTTNRIKEGEEIYIRFSGLTYFMDNDTLKYNNENPNTSPFPQTVVYRGPLTIATKSFYEDSSPGWIAPIRYVGHAGSVKMLIPSSMGFSYDRNASTGRYQAAYYEKVEYRFEDR